MSAVSIDQLALIAAVLLVAGYGVLGALCAMRRTRDIGKDLLATFFSASLIAAVLIGAVLIGTNGVLVLVGVIALRVGYEVGVVRLGHGGLAFAALGLCAATITLPAARYGIIIAWPVLFAALVFGSDALGRWRGIVDVLVFPLLPMALFAHGAVDADLRIAVFGAYVLVEVFDSFALLSGKLFGRRKAFPVLSPRKTVEGLIGGAVGVCVIGGVLAVALGLSVVGVVLIALMVAGMAIVGDLAASRLKRMAGVKDYPVLMARQGGMFDSLDSWIAAAGALVALQVLVTWL
ncbi:phosphatidate cytidylyltransferase [Shimia abyssi]|uniref:Phosphatidate cytidylyltransferase n=1 Tax=Shimia abyssi TaxID=1662395 RepID=A0A2P8FAJ9_9RHOB|nr:phosphatidate cytidylyltransferase [Shimia abyssi]PSL18739.1 phosphatidate cytidylyltransferase [Shimia abyssi]